MRSRAQVLSAVVVLVVVVAGGVYLQREVGPRAVASGPPGQAPSGAWFCPHGGGTDWEVTLAVANPGPSAVDIRVTGLSERRPSTPKSYTVEPGTEVLVSEAAEDRDRSTFIEYFGGWVAAGWVAHAGGGERGVAAEPCLPRAGQRWFVPDGTTTERQEAFVVVMNPFASQATFTLTLYTQKEAPITTKAWTNVSIKPYRSRAFRLNTTALGYNPVSTQIDVKVGRVAAASLGLSDLGGIRSSVGVLGEPPERTILPGGFDQGATTLVAMNTATTRPGVDGTLLSRDTLLGLSSIRQGPPRAASAVIYLITTDGPSTIDVRSTAGVVVARRTLGKSSDQGSTAGSPEAAGAWVVLPAVAGPPFHSGLVLANPGDETVEVTLSVLPSGTGEVPEPVTMRIPAGRTVAGPKLFVTAKPLAAILAVSSSGTLVLAAASYSLGLEGFATYAVSAGVPIPDEWVP